MDVVLEFFLFQSESGTTVSDTLTSTSSRSHSLSEAEAGTETTSATSSASTFDADADSGSSTGSGSVATSDATAEATLVVGVATENFSEATSEGVNNSKTLLTTIEETTGTTEIIDAPGPYQIYELVTT